MKSMTPVKIISTKYFVKNVMVIYHKCLQTYSNQGPVITIFNPLTKSYIISFLTYKMTLFYYDSCNDVYTSRKQLTLNNYNYYLVHKQAFTLITVIYCLFLSVLVKHYEILCCLLVKCQKYLKS